jgi:ribonuclease HI
MDLEFTGELPGASTYRISPHNPEHSETVQEILFSHDGYNIKFMEPYSGHYDYLNSNIRWLRSILCTALKSGNRSGLKIPFTFPAEKQEIIIPENALKVYSDGSCGISGGGWASVIITPDGAVHETAGREENTTGNRMELTAACMGIEKALEQITPGAANTVMLITDSQYVIRGITHRLEVWNMNGFITAMGTPVINRDIWVRVSRIMQNNRVLCRWIKSGSDDPHHLRCDYLAGEQGRLHQA